MLNFDDKINFDGVANKLSDLNIILDFFLKGRLYF